MKKLISYIFPIYNEEGNIDLLYRTMTKVVKKIDKKYDFEFVFINDGSKDNSLNFLLDICKKDKRVKILDFSRNFGHQLAVTAGLDNASGDAVIIMDSDMQDPPEVSLELIKKWEEGFDVVYAQRKTRQDSFFKKFTAMIFYRVLDKLADIRIPKDTGDFRLIDKKVVEAMRSFGERNRFLRGMVSYVGFKQVAVLFDRQERYAGKTGYPLKKMIKFALDGILSFSSFPLKLIIFVGVLLIGISFLLLIFLTLRHIFLWEILLGVDLTMYLFILFLFGVNISMIGIIAEYLGRIYAESQNRPLYIVRRVYENGKI